MASWGERRELGANRLYAGHPNVPYLFLSLRYLCVIFASERALCCKAVEGVINGANAWEASAVLLTAIGSRGAPAAKLVFNPAAGRR